MKFIFPQNYNFKSKFLGVIDYSSILFNIAWDGFVFSLINIFIKNLSVKIFIFISLSFPLLLLTFTGLNGENIVYIFFYLISFYIKPKLYLFKKY